MAWLDLCEVSALEGDLFAQPVDAIVVPVECSLSLTHTLGSEGARRFGGNFRDQVHRLRDDGLGGHLALGNSTSIPLSALGHPAHAVLVAWWAEANDYNLTHIEKCLTTSLREAFRLRVSSMAFPLFGTSSNELRREDLYTAITSVLNAFNTLKNSDSFSVRDLRFVCRKGEYIRQLSHRLAMDLPG